MGDNVECFYMMDANPDYPPPKCLMYGDARIFPDLVRVVSNITQTIGRVAYLGLRYAVVGMRAGKAYFLDMAYREACRNYAPHKRRVSIC